jgi:hypothetical protein
MNPQNNIGKVVSWSIELETSNSGRKTVTQVPQFVAAVIDDFITEIEAGEHPHLS